MNEHRVFNSREEVWQALYESGIELKGLAVEREDRILQRPRFRVYVKRFIEYGRTTSLDGSRKFHALVGNPISEEVVARLEEIQRALLNSNTIVG